MTVNAHSHNCEYASMRGKHTIVAEKREAAVTAATV